MTIYKTPAASSSIELSALVSLTNIALQTRLSDTSTGHPMQPAISHHQFPPTDIKIQACPSPPFSHDQLPRQILSTDHRHHAWLDRGDWWNRLTFILKINLKIYLCSDAAANRKSRGYVIGCAIMKLALVWFWFEKGLWFKEHKAMINAITSQHEAISFSCWKNAENLPLVHLLLLLG